MTPLPSPRRWRGSPCRRGAIEERVQGEDADGSDDQAGNACVRESDAFNGQTIAGVARRHRPLIRSPKFDGNVFEDESEAETDEQGVLDPILLAETCDEAKQAEVQSDTKSEKERRRDEDGKKRIDSVPGEYPEADVAA